jgi:hypothetical protein
MQTKEIRDRWRSANFALPSSAFLPFHGGAVEMQFVSLIQCKESYSWVSNKRGHSTPGYGHRHCFRFFWLITRPDQTIICCCCLHVARAEKMTKKGKYCTLHG